MADNSFEGLIFISFQPFIFVTLIFMLTSLEKYSMWFIIIILYIDDYDYIVLGTGLTGLFFNYLAQIL
jgi:hypothetical protein